MVRTGRLRSAAMAWGGSIRAAVVVALIVLGIAVIGTAVIGMAGTAGWVRPAAARAVQAAPPGDESGASGEGHASAKSGESEYGESESGESTATAPPAGTRPPSRVDGSGSGPVGDLPGAGSDGLPIATGALAAAAVGAAVVAVRRAPSR
jgi:hypothetical protein